jgi:RNase P protein component
VGGRLAAAAADVIEVERDRIHWRFASLADARHHLEQNTPIVIVARQALEDAAYEAVVDELVDLVERRGEHGDGTAIAVPGDYLRVVVRTSSG